MKYDETAPDPELTSEQLILIAQLSNDDLQAIDDHLYSNTDHMWRKVARVVGSTMQEKPQSVKGIPDIFYSQRIRKLVESKKLEHQGYLNRMRYCEVRRANNKT